MFEHDTPAVVKRVVSYDGVNSALEQDFSYSTTWQAGSSGWWTSKQTVVTTKDLLSPGTPSFQTIYNYTPWLPHKSIGSHLDSSGLAMENSIIYKNTLGNVLRTITKVWNSSLQLSGECATLPNGKSSGRFYQYQPYPMPGGLALAAGPQATTTNLHIDVAEYDYGLVTTPCQRPTSTPTKETVTTYASFANTPLLPSFNYPSGTVSLPPIPDRPATVIQYQNGTKVSETDYSYDETPLAAVSPGPVGHDETNYGSASSVARGNPTTITRKCFQGTTACTDSVAKISYDTTGQPISVIDANNNTTTLSYADNYTTDDGSPSGNTNTYITNITRPPTNGISHIETFQWDFNKGQLRTLTDENNQPTSYQYVDPWWRLTQVTFPDGGQVTHSYLDAGPNPSVTTSTQIDTGVTIQSKTVMDAAGHVIQTQLLSDPQGVDYVDTTYDGLGRMSSVSNPYRTTTETTYGITTFNYDSLNRKTLQHHQDGSLVQFCYDNIASSGQTNCSANVSSQSNTTWLDSSDEVGNHWQRTYDVFGRLTSVMEPNGTSKSPSMETDYSYDGLDNLKTVVQNGNNPSNARNRSFVFNSLSELTSATNPESGTITYTYDPNGDVTKKTAPKTGGGTGGTVTFYTYDALNRLTLKTYNNPGSPAARYGYDGTALTGCTVVPPSITSPTNLIGRRSASCSSMSGSKYSYDAMGRLLIEARNNKGSGSAVNHPIQYSYFKDGSVHTVTYPSGDLVTYAMNAAGRVTQVSDAANNFVGYTGNPAIYSPTGALANMVNGHTSTFAGIVTTNIYNKRLQPILLSASVGSSPIFSLCYDFHLGVAIGSSPCNISASSTGNNGNVFRILNNVDSTRSTAYAYDTLNRISQANTITTTGANCWGETYTIDAWANMYARAGVTGMTGCSYESLAATVTNNNQFSSMTYDAAGNVLNDGSGLAPTYDAENRIATAAGVTYYYDADGERTEKSSGTMYWPGQGGNLAETDLAGTINEEYIFFNGQRVARVDRPSGTVHYYFSDHLGSASAIAGTTGSVQQQYFYYPYGGQQSMVGSDPNHYKFTGKERDSESGLDYFEARYFSSPLGRFLQADEFPGGPVDLTGFDGPESKALPYADINDPQSLNKYAYTYNNPLRYVDPNGHTVWDVINGAANAFGSDFFGGAGRQDLGNGDFQLGQAIGDFGAAVVGTGEALLGTGGEAGGLALDSTFVGAPAGVALNVISTAAIAQGVTGAATGVGQLIKAATGGPKAGNAPGVTAGGQATDEHGNKQGPSGKPQVNETNSNTREAANNKAKSQGARTVEHRTPKRGKPHFHSADKQGKKKPGSTHHNFPL
jgi:RHS repeat-associated protein